MKRINFLVLWLTCFLSLAMCKKSVNNPYAPELPDTTLLKIHSFIASPEEILYGEVSTLSWSVSNALKVAIDCGIGEVAAEGTEEVSPTETTVYMLTAYGATETASKTVTVKILATVIMDGLPDCFSSRWTSIYGEDVEIFGLTARIQWGGTLKNVGRVTADSVKLKVILYDPNGNYLTEKHVEFFEESSLETYGMSVDIHPNEHASWRCWWIKADYLDLFEQYAPTINPYRPDKDPERCFVITWN